MTKSPASLVLFIAIIFSMSLGIAYALGYGSINSAQAITYTSRPAVLRNKITPPNSKIGSTNYPTPTRIGGSLPSPTPTRIGSTTYPTPTRVGTSIPSPTPTRIGSTTYPTPTFIGNTMPTPTPTRIGSSIPSPTPTSIGNTGPTNTLLGSDGTYCKDYGNSYLKTKGYCQDAKGLHYDYCSTDVARQFYCSGSWNGKSWTGVYCADGGYSCSSAKLRCSSGGCVEPKIILR